MWLLVLVLLLVGFPHIGTPTWACASLWPVVARATLSVWVLGTLVLVTLALVLILIALGLVTLGLGRILIALGLVSLALVLILIPLVKELGRRWVLVVGLIIVWGLIECLILRVGVMVVCRHSLEIITVKRRIVTIMSLIRRVLAPTSTSPSISVTIVAIEGLVGRVLSRDLLA
jgi:hypothetical protein